MSKKTRKSTKSDKVCKNSEMVDESATLYTQIVSLRNDKGLSYSKIGNELGVSKSTVHKYLKLWMRHIPVSEIRPSGRQRKVTDGVKRQIRAIITNNPCISSKGISKRLAKGSSRACPIDVGSSTVRRTLGELSYANDLPKVVPMLTDAQKSKRVTWCKKNGRRNWDKVVFSDETSIELDRCKIRKWHPKGNRPKVGKTKYSRKLMFWSAIGSSCKSPLIALKDTVNSEKYIELLESHFLPWFRENCTSTRAFQQDNAPAHRSKKTTAFMRAQNLKILDWPANSPDLNPIENVWSILKKAVEERSPKNIEELERFSMEEWDKIPQRIIRKIVKSMGTRIDQVIEQKGEKCDY